MTKLVVAKRNTDLVLSVVKDANGKFSIVDANDEFFRQFGYTKQDIIGRYLRDFVAGDAVAAVLEIESGDSIFDICDLLPRVSGFLFLTSSKTQRLVKIKVFRSVNEENPHEELYEIVMRDFSVSEKFVMFKKKSSLSALDDGGDPLGMMPPVATKSEVEMVLKFVRAESGCEVTIVCVCPDVQQEFIPIYRSNISQSLISTLRAEDKFGTLENGVIIVLLMGCGPSVAEQAITRIHGKVNERLKNEKSVTVSFSYGDAATFADANHAIEILINGISKARDAFGARIIAC